MVEVWNQTFEDVFNCFWEPEFSGWDRCDAVTRSEFIQWVQDDGMEQALLNYVRTMVVLHDVDPQTMLDDIIEGLLNLDEDCMRYLTDPNPGIGHPRIDWLKSAITYLLEQDFVDAAFWSDALAADYEEDVTQFLGRWPSYMPKLNIKAWLIDQLWGLLHEDVFRDSCIRDLFQGDDSDPDAFRSLSWCYLTERSATLSRL